MNKTKKHLKKELKRENEELQNTIQKLKRENETLQKSIQELKSENEIIESTEAVIDCNQHLSIIKDLESKNAALLVTSSHFKGEVCTIQNEKCDLHCYVFV